MRRYTLFLIGFALGALTGQALFTYAYDPTVLESNALGLSGASYSLGCAESEKVDGTCREKALKHVKDLNEIFSNEIWERR